MTGRIRKVLTAAAAAAVCVSALYAAHRFFSAPEVKSSMAASLDSMPGFGGAKAEAVRAALSQKDTYILGMIESSRCFQRPDGSVGGFAQSFAGWMTHFFGVRVEARPYSMDDLRRGLKTGDIDFTCEFTEDYPEGGLYSTGGVSEQYFMQAELKGAPARPLKRIAFLRGSEDMEALSAGGLRGGGEVIGVSGADEALKLLRAGSADDFVAGGAVIDMLRFEEDITARVYSPLTYRHSALATGSAALAPVIEAAEAFLETGGRETFNALSRQGAADYTKSALISAMTAGETAYYDKLVKTASSVSVAFDRDNYPINFYNGKTRRYEGAAVDILDEISRITGIKFETGHTYKDAPEAIFGQRLLNGEIDMAAELIRYEDREGLFLWAAEPYASAQYALIYRRGEERANLNAIWSARVGVIDETGYEKVFRKYFPDHRNIVHFSVVPEALAALERHEVDFVMATENIMLSAADYYGKNNFASYAPFGEKLESAFGFSVKSPELAGIISKAQTLIDVENIYAGWLLRSYDYKPLLTRARAWLAALAAAAAASAAALGVTAARLKRKRGAELEARVNERTRRLEDNCGRLERSFQEKSAFWAKISMDMSAPLNAVIGLSELSLGDGELAGGARANMEKIYNSGIQLLSLVNDVMDVSRIEAGTFEFNNDEYDVPSVINDISVMNAARSGGRPVSFSLIISPDAPVRLIGDEQRVKQIFGNLLANAFKHTKAGAVEWSFACERDGSDYVTIVSTVKDTGSGIRADLLENLFNDRGRAEEIGLGLSITKKLVEMCGGELTAQSVLGRGSAFTVRIRQKLADASPIGDGVASNLKRLHYSNHKRDRSAKFARAYIPYAKILVVDDTQANLEMARGILKPYGMRVDCVTNGQAAVDIIRKGEPRYSAVLMDHMMPGMDGIRAAQMIRTDIGTDYAKTVPIIALTADLNPGRDETFLKNGFQAFLPKPIDILKMDAVINRYVRDRDVERELLNAADYFASEGGTEYSGGRAGG